MKRYLFVFLCAYTLLLADIQLIKKENSDSNTTLLIIAGIHGDEPGGYFAASLLATHYAIKSKNLWIVPNLNQKSIRSNARGIYGDMNRKFASISNDDQDKETIDEIKKIILEKNVSLILNLHDGNGFYRKRYQGTVFNPNAWGQTCVIDQHKLAQEQPFGNLNDIALQVNNSINSQLLKKHHSFDVKNTNTKYEDETMQLSLTYFAVTNNKPAFAIETSKNLSSLAQKVFYQLLAIEEYMRIMGIEFEREFDLRENEIAKLLQNYGNLIINNNILLNLDNIKNSLSYIPIKSATNTFSLSHPLGDVVKHNGEYIVFIGNKRVTTLRPQYFKLSQNCQQDIALEVDGERVSAPKASEVFVNDYFSVNKYDNTRVNVIGYYSPGVLDESGVEISLEKLDKRFSVDKENRVYRVEFYDNNEFCSMLLIHFK